MGADRQWKGLSYRAWLVGLTCLKARDSSIVFVMRVHRGRLQLAALPDAETACRHIKFFSKMPARRRTWDSIRAGSQIPEHRYQWDEILLQHMTGGAQ